MRATVAVSVVIAIFARSARARSEAYPVPAVALRHAVLGVRDFGPTRPFISRGGIALGGGVRMDAAGGYMRGAYEIGVWRPFIAGVAGETDFRGGRVVPTFEIATPPQMFILLLPQLALGVGMPVAFGRDEPVLAGVRGVFTMSWIFFSAGFAYDVYPAASEPALRQTSLFFELTL